MQIGYLIKMTSWDPRNFRFMQTRVNNLAAKVIRVVQISFDRSFQSHALEIRYILLGPILTCESKQKRL
jgi:hypothetical protein